MSRQFFTVRHCFSLLFLLVIGQSQLGFGQDGVKGQEAPSFTAVSSHFFTPGSDFKVFFTVNPHPKNEVLQLKCVLMAKSNLSLTIQSDPVSLRPGESGQISIPLPREMPGNESIWRLFTWSFTAESLEQGYKEDAPHTLIVSRKLANPAFQSAFKVDLYSVFVQTDKPAYKPDDLVRIRVITMGINDRPHLTAGVNISITDSQGNLMRKWEQPLVLPESASVSSKNVTTNTSATLFGEFQKKRNGLSSYEYQLSGEPILGNWTIQVEAGNVKEFMYFDVQKYILPKFQVKVHVPPVFYGTGTHTTSATVQVSYTNGKAFQGSGNVTVTSGYGGQVKIQQFVVRDGEATVPIKLSASSANATVHTVAANITEKNSARWQIGKSKVRIYPQETYSIQWINQPSSYKPGLPITVQLKITGQDGYPVKEARTNAVLLFFPPSVNPISMETSIPPSGIATFTFPTPLEPLPANSTLRVQFKNSLYNFTLPTAENGTSSGIFIDLVPLSDSLNFIQGNSYNFTIISNKPIKPPAFQCLLWDDTGMEAHGAQTIVNNQREPAEKFLFSLQLPKGAYTNLKVFVYFETEHEGAKEIISAFKSTNTHNYLKIRVSRPIPIPIKAPTPAKTTANTEEDDYLDEDVQLPSAETGVSEPNRLTSETLQVEPGAAVQIHFETDPDSTIAIRGIDQSFRLFTEENQDNDLTQERVESKRASLERRQSQLENIPTKAYDFFSSFEKRGLSVLNSKNFRSFAALNLTTARAKRATKGEEGEDEEDEEWDSATRLETAVFDYAQIPQVYSRLRTKFPETWLWEEFQSSNNSRQTVLNKILPDTLTSWIISGFSLNPKTGLGVASPATITGFTPFFITLNLPYSVIRYETMDLQVIVHNYLDRDVNVFVSLRNRHNEFTFVDRRENRNGVATRYINVKANHAAVAHFAITPMVFGDIPIEVSAVTEDGTAADSMLRPLKVKPDGVRQSRTQMVIFSRPKTSNASLTREESFEVNFPTKRAVKGASSLRLTVIGDPTDMASNLGNLVRLPGDSGEENMLSFVSNLLALHYFNATNSKERDIMEQARTNLELGYAHQLQYRKPDGSFAVHEHLEGTTWLTSYVLRWFVEAQKYVTIDPSVIKGATDFLLSRQQNNGSFFFKYNPKMLGQNGTEGVALTAYITLALIKASERSNSDLNLKRAIENGLRHISQESVYQLDDQYITNLVTATLMAGNHAEKTRFFEKMEKAAKTTTTAEGVTIKYWNTLREGTRADDPLKIEMTSYALLAHLWRKNETDSSVLHIHRWLLNQQRPEGGFLSTQDTVMGLTALTEFALKTVENLQEEDELQLNIRTLPNSLAFNDTELSVLIARSNRMVLHEFSLPVSTKSVKLFARGSGRVLVQLTETWYVKLTGIREPEDPFNVTASMTIPDPEEPEEAELTVCINSFEAAGVKDVIASIQLPSGYLFSPEDYEADSEFMTRTPRNLERCELMEGNTKMDVYYTEIKGYPPTCTTFPATRLHHVADAKRPPIVVYEYLNPGVKATLSYIPAHSMNVCQLCDSTGGCDKKDCN